MVPRYIKSNKNKSVEWNNAPDIKKRVSTMVSNIGLDWIKKGRVYCFRSRNSKTRAYARIWGLSRIFQLAMDIKPAYVLEVISERFDKLNKNEQDKVLLHELAHIPKTFSGSLLPHIKKGKFKFEDKVHELIKMHKKSV